MSVDDGVLGSAVAQHPSVVNPRVLQHSIHLYASVSTGAMSALCRKSYFDAVAGDLRDVCRTVNEMICNGSLCEYLTGPPGTGVLVNESAVFSKKVVYAAINTATYTNDVTITGDDFVCHATAYLLVVSFTALH